jgi:MFS family permease
MISFFYYSYTALQLPCGFILDKLGPRNIVGLSAALSTVGSVLFALTKSVCVAQFGRCLMGAGAACAFISCLQVASTAFPIRHFAVFAAITNMMGTFGGLCAGFPIARAVNLIGWRETTFILAAIGGVIAIAAFLLIPKNMSVPKSADSREPFGATFGKILKNKQIILIGIIGGFMYLPVSVFAELWAVPFFMAKCGINNETASFASATSFIGFAIGSVPIAMIAKKLNGYMKTIRLTIISVAALFIPLVYVQDMTASFIVVFLIGFATAGEVLIFTCAKNNESLENSGSAVAFANCFVMLVGAIFQPALGVLLDVFWTGTTAANGLRVYEIAAYQKAMLVLPICLIVAYAMSFWVNETLESERDKEDT